MQPFTFHSPTRITFGEGTASGVGDLIWDLGGKKTLIVTDANIIKAGVAPILSSFQQEKPVVFAQVPPDSDVSCVNQAISVAVFRCALPGIFEAIVRISHPCHHIW